MTITRVATFKATKNSIAAIITIDSKTATITHADKDTTITTEALFKAELEKTVGTDVPIFVHFNDDGSVAIATGQAPDVWPEDDPDNL